MALAAAVLDRRRRLGLAQGDLAALGGPGVVTVGKIERAAIATPQPSTLKALDRALRWQAGSAAGILDGHDPVPMDRPTPSDAVIAAILADPTLLPESKENLVRQYGLLLRVQPEPTAERQLAAVESQAIADIKARPKKASKSSSVKGGADCRG